MTTSYKIHLPTGTVLTAKNSVDLDKLLSLNVCRVYQARQIRIEPVFQDAQPVRYNMLKWQQFRALLVDSK